MLSDEDVLLMVKSYAMVKFKMNDEHITDFMKRKIDIFRSRGYDDPAYETIFFCVTGSPNRLSGMIIRQDDVGFKIITDKGWKVFKNRI